jgi:predicted MFS family arabinose efflux permease
MHLVAAGWAMTTLTDSATFVGLVQTAWAVPGFLLALHAGALADMLDRRKLIAITQVVALFVAGGLAVLDWTSSLTISYLLAGTFLESIALTIAAPAFMALTPELVGDEHLAQALGLDSASRNIAQSVGPALAGIIIAATNSGAVFALNAISFIGIIVVVRANKSARVVKPYSAGVNAAIKEGIAHIIQTQQLRRLAIRLTLVMTATASLAALLPVVAKSALGLGASGFGLLSGALGVGSVVAVWLLPGVRARVGIEVLMFGSSVIWAGGVVMLAMSQQIVPAIVALLIVGMATMALMNTMFSTFIVQLPDWVRGRGSSLAMLVVWFGASVGATVWGYFASRFGVDDALLMAAAATAGIAVVNRVLFSVRQN